MLGTAWDRIYVTTLFSFEFARIAKSIDFAIEVANGCTDKVFVGGIAASLMHERFVAEPCSPLSSTAPSKRLPRSASHLRAPYRTPRHE